MDENTKNPLKSQIPNKLFGFWVLTLVTFYATVFVAKGDFSSAPTLLVIILLLDILLGFFFFVGFLASSLKYKNWNLVGLSLFVVVFFFLGIFMLPSAENNQSSQIGQNDELIDCNVHASCGGGIKKMKSSECTNSTCCQIDKIWVVLDKDQCKLKQQEYANSSKQQAQPVIQVQQVPRFQPPEPPICCKERCNSYTGTCTTQCTKSWICI